MQTINKDNLFSILEFLDVKSLINISKTNKFINKEVKNNKKMILKTKVSQLWGKNICNLIPNEEIDKFLNYNIKSFLMILEFFYKAVINGIKTNSLLLIEIYDHIYMFTNSHENTRKTLFYHRNRMIRKYINCDFISKNDKRIIFILNSTAYLNRFCFFLDGRTLSVSHKTILEMINSN